LHWLISERIRRREKSSYESVRTSGEENLIEKEKIFLDKGSFVATIHVTSLID